MNATNKPLVAKTLDGPWQVRAGALKCWAGDHVVKDETFKALGAEIGALVDEKQAAYGNSFGQAGDVLKVLYPAGIRLDQYQDALCVVRIIDKLFRIATDRDALGESPYRDIAGYGLLGVREVEGKNG